jgi:hypothetical protein
VELPMAYVVVVSTPFISLHQLIILTHTLPEDAEGNNVLDSAFVKEYEDTFINVKEWGVFHNSDLELNDISGAMITTPNFVTEFEGMLDRKPGLRLDVGCFLDSRSQAAYFDSPEDSTVGDESHEETNRALSYAERLEVLHVAHIASYEWQNFWFSHCSWTSKRTPMDCLANAMFFFQLLRAPKNEVTFVSLYVLYLPPSMAI